MLIGPVINAIETINSEELDLEDYEDNLFVFDVDKDAVTEDEDEGEEVGE